MPARPAPSGKWRALARAAFLGLAGAAAFALVWHDRAAIGAALARTDPTLVALALAASLANIALTWVSWRLLLGSAPVRLAWLQSARIFFLGQMGKYLPGSVWSYLATAELAKQAGLARTSAVSSLLLAVLIGAGSGVAMAVLIVPDAADIVALDWWVPLLLIPAALIALWPPVKRVLLGLARIDFPIPASALVLSGAAAGVAWLFAGAQITLLTLALGGSADWGFMVAASGIYALAWVAGFVFFIAPAGLGAREGVLIALLAAQMPMGEAVTIALLARVVVTAADFLLGGAALLIRPASTAPATAQPLHRG
jgi:hypothetical protein